MLDYPLVVIILSNYNGYSIYYKSQPILALCIDSLKSTSYKNYRIILADDCSTDQSIEYVSVNYPYIEIIKNKINSKIAKNRNNAIRYALKNYNPTYLFLLNNDIIITDKDWLTKLVETAELEKAGVVNGKLVYPDGRIQYAGGIFAIIPRNRGRGEIDNGQYNKIELLGWACGGFSLIHREVIEKIGLLDENFLIGYEDIDYGIRAKNAGFKILYNGNVSAMHIEGCSSTEYPDNKFKKDVFYMYQVGYVYFIFKHYNYIKRILALIVVIGAALLSVEGKDRPRRLVNIRLKDKILWRLGISLMAILEGYRIFKKCYI